MLFRKIAAVAAGVVVGAVALAGSAWAHTQVTAKPAQALATNAQLGFSAAAESSKAGIASVRVVLPQGIAPADVTYVSGPAGWALAATADGFQVAGKTLAVGTDAKFAVKVKQLPNARSIAFKTLVNYSDGTVDRWIEIPSAANPDPANPAPVVKLAAAAPGASPAVEPASVSPSPIAVVPSAQASTGTPAAAPSTEPASSGMNAAGWVLIAVLAAVALTLGVVLARRRSARA
ncbi:MAG: DUF1775 domain-containing protein [Hamadaea sp.]|nr:DUF1775 domain-containing protein [Hamadaea sp.]